MKTSIRRFPTILAGLALALGGALAPAAAENDRTVLPLAEPKRPIYKEIDARKAKMPPRFDVKAPKGAPNVVIILIDDIGLRRHQHLRRPDHDADARPAGRRAACATTTSTRRRCARRRAPRSSPAATTTR